MFRFPLLGATSRSLWTTLAIIFCSSLLLHLFYIYYASLLVEEAYYWNYAQHLDFSYLDHPPMVALLIKFFTVLAGDYAISLRLASIFLFVYYRFFQLSSNRVNHKGSRDICFIVVSNLTLFFIESLIITPDAPLIACWSACLYYLYRSLQMRENRCWYGVGVSLGLGMLSKYNHFLLAVTTFFYIITNSKARFWLTRKEPYLAALIAVLLFTPVIYWNATHHWVSFLFQSTERFNSIASFNTHRLLGLVLLFITPPGVWALAVLMSKSSAQKYQLEFEAQRFMLWFILLPLSFFYCV